VGVREGVQVREQVRRPAKQYSISEAFEEKATKHSGNIFSLLFVVCLLNPFTMDTALFRIVIQQPFGKF
jgi:hypothetical protein